MKNINPAARSEHATKVVNEISAMFDLEFRYCRPLYFSSARQVRYDREIQKQVRMIIAVYFF
jgi:hypothetical protein